MMLDNVEASHMNILTDEREIQSIGASLCDRPDYRIGDNGVTKIEAYAEGGMACDIPWIRVYRGTEIITRICAHHLAFISYR